MAFEKVRRGEKTEPSNNRPLFIRLFKIVGMVWALVLAFALLGIWLPVAVAGKFAATAILLGMLNIVASVGVGFAASEMMDYEDE